MHLDTKYTPSSKMVLCRPEGGLTDKLTQIEICVRYANQFNRKVLVDCDFKHIKAFKGKFSDYFISRSPNLILDTSCHQDQFNRMTVYPGSLYQRANQYNPIMVHLIETKKIVYIDELTRSELNFMIDKAYDEELLVHHQLGGNIKLAINLLNRVSLQDVLVDSLEQRLREVGSDYCAIHIRNTDIKTDYLRVIQNLKNTTFTKLFVATDDKQVIRDFQKEFGNKIYSFSELTESKVPVHYQSEKRDEHNRDAILDLIMLSLSKKLYLVEISNIKYSKYSGYSRLAAALQDNKEIIKNLLSTNSKFLISHLNMLKKEQTQNIFMKIN